MASNDRDVVLDHDYDGIREYDNPTPPGHIGELVFRGETITKG